MVFGRKKKDEDMTEIRRKAVEKARLILEQEEAALKAQEEATAKTPVIAVEEPAKIVIPRVEVHNIGQYAQAAPAQPAPQPLPRIEPPTPPVTVDEASKIVDELTAKYGEFCRVGFNPADSQYLRLLLLFGIYQELKRLNR